LISFGSHIHLIYTFQSLLCILPIPRITFMVQLLHSHIIWQFVTTDLSVLSIFTLQFYIL
jgi:hypothetical protein